MPSIPDNLARAEIPKPYLDILQRLRGAGHHAFLVGGCVRDMVMGQEPKDFDIATSARPEQVQKLFRKVIPTGIQHGTVTVLSGSAKCEVTTFRTEGEYRDGRRPSSISFHEDVEEDLSRRDFTVNAMAFDPLARRLVDPFGGQEDLRRRLIRCVGVAKDRFSEDGLRPLRAVRFSAVLGFSLDGETEAAIPQALNVFAKVSLERVREEFTKLLLSDRADQGVQSLQRLGLLSIFWPEALVLPIELGQRSAHAQVAPRTLSVRLAAICWGSANADALRRLTFPNQTVSDVALLLAHPLPEDLGGREDVDFRRFAAEVGKENLPSILDLAQAQRGASAVHPIRDRFERLLKDHPALSAKDLALNGEQIMAELGVGPSPAVGKGVRYLLDKVLEHPEWNSPEKLRELLTGFHPVDKRK